MFHFGLETSGLTSAGALLDSGNMLIIMLAYAQATGDGSLLAQHVRGRLCYVAVWLTRHRLCSTVS